MLPCTRNCAGKKLTHWRRAWSDPVLAEPLLFLYPQWYQTLVQRANPLQRRAFSKNTSGAGRVAAEAEEEVVEESKPTQSFAYDASSPYRNSKDVSKSQPEASGKLWPGFAAYKPIPADCERGRDRSIVRDRSGRQHALSERYNPRNIKALAFAVRLFRMAPAVQTSDQDTLHLTASFLQWLTGTSGVNAWKHFDGYGCNIHVDVPSDASSPNREVKFYGTQFSRELAMKHLQHMQELHTASMCIQIPNRSVREDLSPAESYSPVDQIPKPESWNLKTFYEYIEAITEAKQPRSVERILYPQKESYNRKVAELLVKTFSDHALQPHMSSAALGQALGFVCEKTDISFAASGIWAKFRQAGIVPDINCYNLEIRRRLRVGNMGGIFVLIRDMESTHVRPDATTWALGFEFLRSRPEQAKFLNLLSMVGIKPSDTAKTLIIRSLVKTEFVADDHRQSNVSSFHRSMQKTFGENWLTPAVVESMIEKCHQARAFLTVSRILELAKNLDVTLDTGALLAVTRAIYATRCFEDMIEFMEAQRLNVDQFFRQSLINVAFSQAWTQQLCNTCRVLWHYAASNGTITRDMTFKVGTNLVRNENREGNQPLSLKTSMAVATIDTTMPDPAVLAEFQMLTSMDQETDVISLLSRWQPNDHRRHYQMQLGHWLLERNMTAWQRLKPMKYDELLDQIKKAFALDTTWQEQSYMSKLSIHEIAKRSITIHLEPLESGVVPEEIKQKAASVSSVMDAERLSEDGYVSSLRRSEAVQGRSESIQSAAHRVTVKAENLRMQDLRGLCTNYTLPSVGATPAAIMTNTSIPLIDFLMHYLGLA